MPPTVVINDERFDCRRGDNLLAVAREHGSHVWFVCDGRRVCRTCTCRVVGGHELLSAATALELQAISDDQRAAGYRLACQSRVIGEGEVRLVSIAEQLRRDAARVAISGDRTRSDALMRVIRELAQFTLNTNPSFIAREAVAQLSAMPPTVGGMQRYLVDAQRIAWRMLGDAVSVFTRSTR